MKKVKIFVFFACIITLVCLIPLLSHFSAMNEMEMEYEMDIHVKFLVRNNSDLAALADSGYGNESHPYIIENKTYVGTGFNTVYEIEDTDVYFMIRNCTLDNFQNGIELDNVTHARIQNNTITNCFRAFYAYNSPNNTIINNSFLQNEYGASIDGDMVSIEWNYFRENEAGLACSLDNSNITRNNFTFNTKYGMFMSYGMSNNISHNVFTDNGLNYYEGSGFRLIFSYYNLIHMNYFSHNQIGIDIDSSERNIISNNEITLHTDSGVLFQYKACYNTLSNNLIQENLIGVIFADRWGHSNNIVGNQFLFNLINVYYSDISFNYFGFNTLLDINAIYLLILIPLFAIIGVIFFLKRTSINARFIKNPFETIEDTSIIDEDDWIKKIINENETVLWHKQSKNKLASSRIYIGAFLNLVFFVFMLYFLIFYTVFTIAKDGFQEMTFSFVGFYLMVAAFGVMILYTFLSPGKKTIHEKNQYLFTEKQFYFLVKDKKTWLSNHLLLNDGNLLGEKWLNKTRSGMYHYISWEKIEKIELKRGKKYDELILHYLLAGSRPAIYKIRGIKDNQTVQHIISNTLSYHEEGSTEKVSVFLKDPQTSDQKLKISTIIIELKIKIYMTIGFILLVLLIPLQIFPALPPLSLQFPLTMLTSLLLYIPIMVLSLSLLFYCFYKIFKATRNYYKIDGNEEE